MDVEWGRKEEKGGGERSAPSEQCSYTYCNEGVTRRQKQSTLWHLVEQEEIAK